MSYKFCRWSNCALGSSCNTVRRRSRTVLEKEQSWSYSRWIDREIERGRNKVSEGVWREKVRWDLISPSALSYPGQCGFMSRDISGLADTSGGAMGSRGTKGEDAQHRIHRRLMCFQAIYKTIKMVRLWEGLKSNQGIGVQKFIWRCHNSSVYQYNLITSAAELEGQRVSPQVQCEQAETVFNFKGVCRWSEEMNFIRLLSYCRYPKTLLF